MRLLFSKIFDSCLGDIWCKCCDYIVEWMDDAVTSIHMRLQLGVTIVGVGQVDFFFFSRGTLAGYLGNMMRCSLGNMMTEFQHGSRSCFGVI